MPNVRCPHCDAELQLDAEEAGQRIRCPECNGTFTAKFRERKSSRRRDDEDEDDFERRPLMKKPKANGMAIAGMVCGIVALVVELPAFGVSVFGVACCCFNIVSWPMHALAALLGVLGLVFGLLGMRQPKGKGMGIAGAALGGVTLILAIVGIVLGILGVAVMGARGAAMPTMAPIPAPPPQQFPQVQPLPQQQPRPNPFPKPKNNL